MARSARAGTREVPAVEDIAYENAPWGTEELDIIGELLSVSGTCRFPLLGFAHIAANQHASSDA